MKTSYLWLAMLCFSLFAFRPSAWVQVNLDNRVSVLLPSQPQAAPMPEPVKVLSAKDTVGTYIVMTSPLGADFQGEQRKQYYDSVVNGVLEQGKGKLAGRSTFTLNGYSGVDFAASITRPDNGQSMLIFARCLIVDKKAYVLQFIPASGTKNGEALSKPFLTSLTLH
ncbi:hypothetical protein HHL22_09580 [Hymenobacter sp. RP-2-7]|uniref:DUF1795 domain-containing protein n=1 Tax=Hymenobacter polaris TaxID=2682546 RepID=A0A7Y0ADR5_9BACT|nr:hypothetical protein [Hymenobacter polaris]NML65454.1 hypothetical protein [Hymenobacter polaris]